ncbi:MAG TPA: FtsX-like permease family protein [Thermoanaerobaculia bacterium]|nr:FtsX-like permease family protein [Thermoanaerobaculia bacterium]
MKFFPLIWSNLKRRKLRTAFTLLSILVAFLLFGYLAAVRMSFSMGVDVVGADRLSTIHKTAIIMPLPVSYGDRIAKVPGVKLVSHFTWFGGIYQDPKNFFGQMAVDTDTFLPMYTEYVVKPNELAAWKADRAGVLIGRTTAERFGWKVGDRIPIQGTIYRKQDGTPLWEFNISGIYDGSKKAVDLSNMYFHYDYLDQASQQAARRGSLGWVGWYVIRIDDPAKAPEISKKIDGLFANSPSETKTQTEKALAQSFANQVGNIGKILTGVLGAVFFTLLLVVGNTMAQAVRERTNEMAVLKTVGFQHGQVLALVLAESCLLAILGGLLGLGLAWTLITVLGDPTKGQLPVFYLPGPDLALGVGLAILLGLVTGAFPAWQAMRLRIADALRR